MKYPLTTTKAIALAAACIIAFTEFGPAGLIAIGVVGLLLMRK